MRRVLLLTIDRDVGIIWNVIQHGMCSGQKRLCSSGHAENAAVPPPRPNRSAAAANNLSPFLAASNLCVRVRVCVSTCSFQELLDYTSQCFSLTLRQPSTVNRLG